MLRMRPISLILALSLSIWGGLRTVDGQDTADKTAPDSATTEEQSTIPPLILDISRRSLKNFVTDAVAATPYQGADGSAQDLEGAFMVGSVEGRYALIWDTLACRLLGVLDMQAPPAPETDDTPRAPGSEIAPERPSPYVLLAEGGHPLTGSPGSFGSPQYFGFRLIDGLPEFLYMHGSLMIEERLWLEDGGNVLKQRFSARESGSRLAIKLPEVWKSRAEANVGTWNGVVLSVPEGESSEVVITYQLGAPETETEEEN